MRWERPYRDATYARRIATQFDGRFVKLVASEATRARVPELRTFIQERSAGAGTRSACYWFDDDFHDAGRDYCRDCAEKLVDEKHGADPQRFEELYGESESDEERYSAAIDGGFDTEHDSPPYCEGCGIALSGNLTEYGVDEELETIAGRDGVGCHDAEDWARLGDAVDDLENDDPRWCWIARLVDAARAQERERVSLEARHTTEPGMTMTRKGLLDLLVVRRTQRAPEPSYRLWDELRQLRSLPAEERMRPSRELKTQERRLQREAVGFLAHFGYMPSGICFETPYGTYYWAFVVEVEQYRLWQPPAFREGAAYRLHPCPSGDPEWPHHRDANPYLYQTEEYRQWDAGYISAGAV